MQRIWKIVGVAAGSGLQTIGNVLVLVLLARWLGPSLEMDGYLVGMTPALFLSAITSSVAPAVLFPWLSEALRKGDSAGASSMIESYAFFWNILGIGTAVVVFLFAEPIAALLTNDGHASIDIAVSVLRISIWLIPLSTFSALCTSVLNAKDEFLLPAIVGAMPSLAAVMGAWAGGKANALAWAPGFNVSMAVAAAFLLQRRTATDFVFVNCLARRPRVLPTGMLRMVSQLCLNGLAVQLLPALERYYAVQASAGMATILALSSRFAMAPAALLASASQAVVYRSVTQKRNNGGIRSAIRAGFRDTIGFAVIVSTILVVFYVSLTRWLAPFLSSREVSSEHLQQIFALYPIYAIAGVLSGTSTLLARVYFSVNKSAAVPLWGGLLPIPLYWCLLVFAARTHAPSQFAFAVLIFWAVLTTVMAVSLGLQRDDPQPATSAPDGQEQGIDPLS